MNVRSQLLFGSEDTAYDTEKGRNDPFRFDPLEPPGTRDVSDSYWPEHKLPDVDKKKKQLLYDPTRENLQFGASQLVFGTGYEPLIDDTVIQERDIADRGINFAQPYRDKEVKRRAPKRYDYYLDRLDVPTETANNALTNRTDFSPQ